MRRPLVAESRPHTTCSPGSTASPRSLRKSSFATRQSVHARCTYHEDDRVTMHAIGRAGWHLSPRPPRSVGGLRSRSKYPFSAVMPALSCLLSDALSSLTPGMPALLSSDPPRREHRYLAGRREYMSRPIPMQMHPAGVPCALFPPSATACG